MSWLLVGLGGALGAMLRYGTGLLLATSQTDGEFPWATLTVNILGSAAIGLLWGSVGSADWFASWGRAFLVVGLLGGFTTFSAFSFETLALIHDQRLAAAFGYVAVSLLACIAAAAAGYTAGSTLS